jgi:hypothetical protein
MYHKINWPTVFLKRNTLSALFVGSFFLISSAAFAEPFLSYDVINGNAATGTLSPTQFNSQQLTPSVLTATGLGFAVDASGLFLWRGWDGTNENRYFEWSVTPEALVEIDYISASLPLATGGGSIITWELRASTDGFNISDIGLGSVVLPSGAPMHSVFDLTGLGAQSGTVTFRVFGSGANTSGTVGGFQSEATLNVILEGEVTTVPEPGVAVLILLGCSALLASVRGRRGR